VTEGATDSRTITIVAVTGVDTEAIDAVRTLFAEYHAWLGEVVCAETMAEEIESLPAPYDPPFGRLLLAADTHGLPLGVVGVRQHGTGVAEMKRLFVRPSARGLGVGRALTEAPLVAAVDLGYREIRLTTLPSMMEGARRMYALMGFSPTEPFEDFSRVREGEGVLFMRRDLP
jgi:GNAT superfamily N-acetyltransferase